MPSPPFPGLRPHRQGCQDDRPSRQSLYVTGRHPGAGIPPHVLQMGALGQAPAGRGRACGGHCCRQVWGRGLQGVTLVHPSLLLPQEGPRHGQMVLLGGVPWASTQPAPTAASADPAAPCLRPPAPPQLGRHCAPWENRGCGVGRCGRSWLFPAARGGRFSGSSPCYRCESQASGDLGAPHPKPCCW